MNTYSHFKSVQLYNRI